ncbi:MAG: hypothetical protein H0V80_08180 [Acidobacteria bacterium]|nr:hypothetical protein [Acidobacteriota bacterium]
MSTTLVVVLMVVACGLCLAFVGVGLLVAALKDTPRVERHGQRAHE